MYQYSIRAGYLGALYTAATSFLAAIGLSVFWEGAGDGLLLLMITFVPAVAIVGLPIGLVLFLITGLTVYNFNSLRNSPIVSYAAIGAIASLIPLSMFCALAAGGKGCSLAFVPGILAAISAGAAVGWKH